jgi:hypothetical protein
MFGLRWKRDTFTLFIGCSNLLSILLLDAEDVHCIFMYDVDAEGVQCIFMCDALNGKILTTNFDIKMWYWCILVII